MELNHPDIKKYGHHHRAMYHCEDLLQLEAVKTSIKATVFKKEPTSPELPLLNEAYKLRARELKEADSQSATEKEAVLLIKRDGDLNDNVRHFTPGYLKANK